jgi:hypothetical protein
VVCVLWNPPALPLEGGQRDALGKGRKLMPVSKTLLSVMVLAHCLCEAQLASADIRSFKVHFAGCTEFVGWGPVSLAAAQPLVPAGYVIAGAADGQAAIVVRATSCEDVSVDDSSAQPTELSQIGINLVPPDGTGDINNYIVIYLTNSQSLAKHFQIAGLPAVFDPQLTYEYTPAPDGLSGALYVSAAGELPSYFLFGTEAEPPPNSQQSFLANWWFSSPEGRMKQSTLFPVISFGTATVSLYTSNVSLLGNLIGGNTDANFSILSVRGVYPMATMTVSFKRLH